MDAYLEFRGDPFSRIFTQSKNQGANEWRIRNSGIQDIPEYSREINAVKEACSALRIYVKEFSMDSSGNCDSYHFEALTCHMLDNPLVTDSIIQTPCITWVKFS